MNRLFFFITVILLVTKTGVAQKFDPTWESLGQYKIPEWFKDAKFGIYTHWGPPSTFERNSGWLGRHMYRQEAGRDKRAGGWGRDYYNHLERYGHPSEHGYKDIIPDWKAENWDPDSLMKLFKKAGAKYFAAMAVHHDNFDCYDSKYQPWNSVNMGPKRDIVGDWKKAAVQNGLKFGVTSHSDRTWSWFAPAFGADDSTGTKPGVPYDGNMTIDDGKGKWWEGYDPADLYTRPHDPEEGCDMEYCAKWYLRTKDLLDKYQPDLLYYDSPIPIVDVKTEWVNGRPVHEIYGLDLTAYFYNKSQEWNNGKLEAVMTVKEWNENSFVNENAIVEDVEKGGLDEIQERAWQTDTSLPCGWYYNGSESSCLTDTVVIHNLCDIVSKNGNMLLNVGLKADGTLPENEIQILENIGEWLTVNGEAIYGTRPWFISEEGPTKLEKGHFKENRNPLTSEDIRFTTKGDTLYAIFLGWPDSGKTTIKSLGTNQNYVQGIQDVSLVGSEQAVSWKRSVNGLVVRLPKTKPCRYAYALAIKIKK